MRKRTGILTAITLLAWTVPIHAQSGSSVFGSTMGYKGGFGAISNKPIMPTNGVNFSQMMPSMSSSLQGTMLQRNPLPKTSSTLQLQSVGRVTPSLGSSIPWWRRWWSTPQTTTP